jgi:prepilin-type N-terminal cleavage/methylation domain-containing protein
MNLKRGMTLTEILVSVAIIALISVAIGSFQRNVFVYSNNASASITTAQDARAIVRTMVAELRSAAPSANGAYAITQAGTSTITFFSDVDGNGIPDQVRYFANGTKLYRGLVVPTGSPLVYSTSTEKLSLLAPNLRNIASTSIFTYYDGTYDGTSSTTALSSPIQVTSVRLVKISLILDVDQNNLPVSRTYTTQVTLRNLKDNL